MYQKDKALFGAGESKLSLSMLLLNFFPVCLFRSLLIWEVCPPLPLFQPESSVMWTVKFRAGRGSLRNARGEIKSTGKLCLPELGLWLQHQYLDA